MGLDNVRKLFSGNRFTQGKSYIVFCENLSPIGQFTQGKALQCTLSKPTRSWRDI